MESVFPLIAQGLFLTWLAPLTFSEVRLLAGLLDPLEANTLCVMCVNVKSQEEAVARANCGSTLCTAHTLRLC